MRIILLDRIKLSAVAGIWFHVIIGCRHAPSKPFKRSIILFFILFFCNTACATDNILLRLQANPKNPWVGQKVVLQLDVMAADGWAQLKKTGDVEIKGGYLLRLESQGTRLSETINELSYSGQRYEFLFYAQQGGSVIIPEMAVDVEVKSWGADGTSETEQLMTPSLLLSVRKPPGLGQRTEVVSTSDFSATQSWKPDIKSLTVGDAIVREISLTATDVTGMVFTPLNHIDVVGTGIYVSEPMVDDSYNRGTLVGKRREKITYMLEQPGELKLPDLEYTWWNTAAEKLETANMQGLTVQVSGTPGPEQSGALVKEKQEHSFISLLWFIFLIAIFVAVVYRYRGLLLDQMNSWQRAYRDSERYYFRRIKSAARQGKSMEMISFTMQWLDRLDIEHEPARLDQFLSHCSDASGMKIYDEFVSSHSGETDIKQTQKLFGVLAASRSRWLKEKTKRKKTATILPEVGLSAPNTNNLID